MPPRDTATPKSPSVRTPQGIKDIALLWFECANSNDMEKLRTILAGSDFKHEYLPRSAGGLGKVSRNEEEFVKLVNEVLAPSCEWFRYLEPKEVIVGEDAVVVHIESEGMLHCGQSMRNEYMMIFHFDKDGKIVGVKEFMDTNSMTGMQQSMGAGK